MSAEAIARVVADIRTGRVQTRAMPLPKDVSTSGPVVDATTIYQSNVESGDPIAIYEDHPCIAPPWPSALLCYENEHGNVHVMLMNAHPVTTRWKTAERVDWDRVRWQLDTYVFLGGRGGGGPVATIGPMHIWQFAIEEDGTPADLHWVQLEPNIPMEHWDNAHLVLLGALNFMNCRNVEIVEPSRPRAEARRLARTGIQVHTINVFPVGKSSRSRGAGEGGAGVPLTSVRGHFARYGPEYDRGLLFGKLAGRFWIPQFARGSREHGESDVDYRLRTDGGRS